MHPCFPSAQVASKLSQVDKEKKEMAIAEAVFCLDSNPGSAGTPPAQGRRLMRPQLAENESLMC